MSLIAEYELDNPILAEARIGVSGVTYEIVDEFVSEEGIPILTAWAVGDESNLERFDRLIADDPTVLSIRRLAELEGRRLYHVELSDEGAVGMTYPVAVEHGITFLEVRASGDTVQYRARVPGRDALVAYRRACEERELAFRLTGLYRAESVGSAGSTLTSRQRELLRAAFEAGYFSVPRRTTLEQLSSEFDISEQALSATLRRGLGNLLGETIASDLAVPEPTESS